jgi:arabinogalactan endo-1,4-beta-galactosidase
MNKKQNGKSRFIKGGTAGSLLFGLLIAGVCAPGRLWSVPSRPQFLVGADLSSATQYESAGIVFKDAGQPKPLLQIFRDHGANCIRLRLFVNPEGRGEVVNDLPYTLALAKRAKALGCLILLDFHYSDTCWHHGNTALFDDSDNALPALSVFRQR